jgi:hypothetical protein
MRSEERVWSRLELDERARSARLCLEEAGRGLATDRPHTLREWLLAVMRHQTVRRDGSDGTS